MVRQSGHLHILNHRIKREMKRRNIAAACVLLAVAVGYGYQTALLPARTLPNTPDPSFFPWINTIMLGVLSFALLIQAVLRPNDEGVMGAQQASVPVITALVLILLYVVAMPFLGFVLSSVPLFALFMVLHNERRKLWLLIGAVGIPIFLFNLFKHLFGVPLPRGIFLGLLG